MQLLQMKCSCSRCRKSSSRQLQHQQMNQVSLQGPLLACRQYECLAGRIAAAAAAMGSLRAHLWLQRLRVLVLQQMQQAAAAAVGLEM
jgi:hypothetical protein